MHKNLLELCLSPDLGGLELYMVRAAKALNDDFNLISVINEKGKIEEYFDNAQYQFKKITRKRSFSILTAKKLSKIIDDNDIDVIHMHWTKDLPIAVMAKLLSKKRPKLVQTRNMVMTRFKDDFYHRFLYKHMDMILPVSYQVAAQINKFIPESIRPKVEVLYMGSDKPDLLNENALTKYREELGLKQDEFLVSIVGRIEEPKGQYLLIEAAEKLKNEGIDIKIFFVGHAMEESYLKKLKQIVEDKDLVDEVIFYGFTKNPHQFMQACDVVVLATECETFGLVVIEAMQVGTPVIATNQCGPLEIIEHEVSGLLFEKNSSTSLAKQISFLYENKDRRMQIAKKGQSVANERFSNTKQFSKLSEVLRSV